MKDQNKFTYERVAIDSLKPMPKNTRKHSERNIAVIAESLRRWGQQKDIVVTQDNIVLAGNGTIEAAKRLGWDTIDIKRSDLKGSDARAYSITDNRSAELAQYHDDNLKEDLQALEEEDWDLDALGWNDSEIADIGVEYPEDDSGDDSPKDTKLQLIVAFENEDLQQELFLELRDRGYKVKA